MGLVPRPIVVEAKDGQKHLVGGWPKEALIARDCLKEFTDKPVALGDAFVIRLHDKTATYTCVIDDPQSDALVCRLMEGN